MGFHLIDQAACFAAGQPTVRGCIVPNGRSTQGGNSGRGSACIATAATCFLGWLAWLTSHQRQINGLQRCNSLLCGCQILQGKAVHRLIGRQHGFAAAQAVEYRMGAGELLPVVGGRSHGIAQRRAQGKW